MDASGLLKGLRTLKIVEIGLPTDQNTAQGGCSQVSVRFVAEQSAPAEAYLEFNRPGPVDGADDDATEIASREQETLSTEHFVLVQPDALTGESNSRVDVRGQALTETVQPERLVSVTFDAQCSSKELTFNTTTGTITGLFKATRPRPIPRSINVLHGVCYGAQKLIPGTNIALMQGETFIRVNTKGSSAVALRSMESARFLRCSCVEGDLMNKDLVLADGMQSGYYCSWLEEDAGDGQIALRSAMNGKFVSTGYGGEEEIQHYNPQNWNSSCIGLTPGNKLEWGMKFEVVPAKITIHRDD